MSGVASAGLNASRRLLEIGKNRGRGAALMVVARPMTSSLWKMKGLKSSSAMSFGSPHWCSFSVGPTTITERPE